MTVRPPDAESVKKYAKTVIIGNGSKSYRGVKMPPQAVGDGALDRGDIAKVALTPAPSSALDEVTGSSCEPADPPAATRLRQKRTVGQNCALWGLREQHDRPDCPLRYQAEGTAQSSRSG
jgi:hypothetical protein